MKKVLMWCLVGLLAIGSAARSQAQTAGGTEKAVAALEEQWLQSQKTNKPDLVAPLLADKFVSTGADGKVMNKAEALANAKATDVECRIRRCEGNGLRRYGHRDGRLQRQRHRCVGKAYGCPRALD